MPNPISTTLVFCTLFLGAVHAMRRETCTPCNPPGKKSSMPPAVGADMDELWVDLIGSVQGIHFKRDKDSSSHGAAHSLCCAETTNCVLIQNYKIPMCYDKFTTNFVFADESYGNINSGVYNAKSGQVVNLITGNVSDGTNIYASNLGERPNPTTLSVPPLYTAAGVGGALGISNLGSILGSATYTLPNIVALATSSTAVPTTTSATASETASETATEMASTTVSTVSTMDSGVTIAATASASNSASQTDSPESKQNGAHASNHFNSRTWTICILSSLVTIL